MGTCFLPIGKRTRSSAQGIFSSTSQHLTTSTGIHYPAKPTSSVPRDTWKYSTGILTCLPSTTPFGLALGPDSPSVDEPCGGNLRFSEHWILTNVFATQSDILTSISSISAFANTSSYNGTLPYRYINIYLSLIHISEPTRPY